MEPTDRKLLDPLRACPEFILILRSTCRRGAIPFNWLPSRTSCINAMQYWCHHPKALS